MVKAFFVFGIAAVTLVASARDVTDQLENLGSPFLKRYPDSFRKGSGAYARNVWTMRAFDGRVYLGCGNSSNGGPATGCGPVPVGAYVAEDGPGMFQARRSSEPRPSPGRSPTWTAISISDSAPKSKATGGAPARIRS